MISVIVPCYNVEKYIERCIESILTSTYKDIELIIVDDCSTDGTLSVVRKKHDKRIRIIAKTQNEGVSKARNDAIKQARGEFLMFVDSDDWISSDCLYTYVNAQRKDNWDLVVSKRCVVVQNDGEADIYSSRSSEFFESKDASEIFEQFFGGGIGYSAKDISSWNQGEDLPRKLNGYTTGILFKKEIVLENNIYFSEALTVKEDTFFLLNYLLHTKAIGVINKDFYFYRIRADRSNTVATVDVDLYKGYKNKIGQLAERSKLRKLLLERSGIDILPLYCGSVLFGIIDTAIICNKEIKLGYKKFKAYINNDVKEAGSLITFTFRNLKFNIPLILCKMNAYPILYLAVKILCLFKLDKKIKGELQV